MPQLESEPNPKGSWFQCLALSSVSNNLHKTQCLSLWYTANCKNCQDRNTGLLAVAHTSDLQALLIWASASKHIFACTPDKPYGCTPIPSTTDIKAQLCLLL